MPFNSCQFSCDLSEHESRNSVVARTVAEKSHVTALAKGNRFMSPKQLVAALVLACFAFGPATKAFAQAAAPVPPPAPQAPQYPPAQYPAQYPQRVQPVEQYPPPPPPASAMAPNGEFVAPMSQTTQPTYVPQSVAMSGPRFIKDWEEGQPIPYGYHHETRVRKGLVITGSVVFGVLYLYSTFFAAVGSDAGTNKLGWMAVPVVGPFLETSETSSATLQYILVLDGLAQAAGVAMLFGGFMYPKHLLVRNDLASMTVVPMKIGMDGSGLGVVGRF
jgi:hypothetical protein